MIDTLAQHIVDRLAARPALAKAKVEHFPDVVPKRWQMSGARVELLVIYEGGTDSEQQSFAPASTERTLLYTVAIFVRSLRGPEGAHATIEHVRQALFGWRSPLGGTAFVPVKDGFVGEDEGVWRFGVTFRTTIPDVAELAQPAGAPLLAPLPEDIAGTADTTLITR